MARQRRGEAVNIAAMRVEMLAPPWRNVDREQLIDLLIDAVRAGASIGFLAPLDRDEARAFWDATERGATTGERAILVARDDAAASIVGTAQIAFVARTNGRHRAEVQKVLVNSGHRRRGVARLLITELESLARSRGVRLLYLDTSEGSGGAVDFYEALGYAYAGGIPGWALDPDGTPAKNAIFYKELPPG